MVVAAEQHAVVDGGFALFAPGPDVVGFGPAGRPVTVRERATKISVSQRPALSR